MFCLSLFFPVMLVQSIAQVNASGHIAFQSSAREGNSIPGKRRGNSRHTAFPVSATSAIRRSTRPLRLAPVTGVCLDLIPSFTSIRRSSPLLNSESLSEKRHTITLCVLATKIAS